ncbi:MAG: hypothetical protein ACPL7B_02800 [Candidatus Poribacteria bacterium]
MCLIGILTFICMISINANARVVVDTDFGNTTQEINIIDEQKKLQIKGNLPDGWVDNSNWASLNAEYIPLEEGGTRFLRINVEKLMSGWCQLAYSQPLPKPSEGNYYRLSLKLRNPSRVTIAVAIRAIDEPYEYIIIEKGNFSKSWQEYTFNYQTKSVDKPIGLYFAVIGEGFCDVARLELQELTKDELINDFRANYKESKGKNILRISRFPLGLQSGWSLNRDNSDTDDVVISVDEKIGISGSPTLKISSDENMSLWITCFKVENILSPHIASIYAQGDWNGRIIVACEKNHLTSEKIALKSDSEWQRIKLTFLPNIIGKAYAIKLEGKGTIWLDAMQVEAGNEATEYKSSLPCEVSLACPKSDTSNILVQFDDEKPIIRYCVSGEAENSKLKVKVVNVYGDEKWIDDIPIGKGFLNYGEFRYDVFPNRPYGSFRIEAYVQNRDGEKISTDNEIVVHRLRRPHYWMKDAPNSPFGVHTNSTVRHILMAKAVGANWTRLHDAGGNYFMWYSLEPQKGQWIFYDKEINRYRRYGIKILAELGTAPKWASFYQDVSKDHSDYFDKFYQPKNLDDYANYVKTVAERYKGVIDAYDVWNEPWIHAWWGVGYDEEKKAEHGGYVTSERPMEDFVKLMATAYKTAKSVDENNTILGFNTTTMSAGRGNFSGDEWTRGVLESGGLNFCDVICYHDYTVDNLGYPNDASEKGFKMAFGAIEEILGKIPKPVWMTEGLSTMLKNGAGFYNHTIPYISLEDVIDTSDNLCRYVVSHLGLGVKKVFLYSMGSHSYFPEDSLIQYRLLVTEEGFLHPSGSAFSNMAWHLEDMNFVKRLTLADGVYAYIFEGQNKAVAVLSPMTNHSKYKLAFGENAHISDLFGNPLPFGYDLGDTLVYVLIEGNAEELINLLIQVNYQNR